MAFKLTKAQVAQRDELVQKLDEHASAVNAAISAYNETLTDAQEFASGIAEDARSEWEDKSERWQEGDKGQAADTCITEWEQPDFDTVEEPDLGHHETLAGLPEEAE